MLIIYLSKQVWVLQCQTPTLTRDIGFNDKRLRVLINFKSKYLRVRVELKFPSNIANVPANILPKCLTQNKIISKYMI